MAYIGNQPGTGVRNRFIYTATASQTTFTGADNNSKTLKYSDADYIDVYLNGVCLVPVTDYAASTKTSVVLVQAASLNDTLEVVAYDIATISDTVSKADGGTFEANVTFAAAADIITETLGTDNVRLGENAGDSIASGGNQNVLIGKDAGTALTTGDDNVAVGHSALKTEDGNGRNTAVGFEALLTLNAGADGENVAVGYRAGKAMTTGIMNTLVGTQAGDALTDADYNTVVGRNAMSNDTKGNRAVAIGYGALTNQNFTSSTDNYNVGVGFNAGEQITTGTDNTIVGSLAGDAMTTAAGATIVGKSAASALTTGGDNTAIGKKALEVATTAHSNVAVGKDALNQTTTASENTAVGYQAGLSNTTGDKNIGVGAYAGSQITTGGANVCIGYQSGDYSQDLTTGSKNVLVGAYTRTYAADEEGANVFGYNVSGDGGYTTIGQDASDIRAAHGTATWATVSDERYKKDIADSTTGLSFVNNLKPRTFKYKAFGELPDTFRAYKEGSTEVFKSEQTQHGFIAQEVKTAIDADSGIKDGFKFWDEREDGSQEVAETALIPVLVKAIQELSAKIETLETKVAALEAE